MLCCAVPALSADIPDHAITITPGQPWSMVVQYQLSDGISVERTGNSVLSHLGFRAPAYNHRHIRFYIEDDATTTTQVTLSMSAKQTAALTDKNAEWSLIYMPKSGPALLIARGKIEVKL
jgi:hypothetical protein